MGASEVFKNQCFKSQLFSLQRKISNYTYLIEIMTRHHGILVDIKGEFSWTKQVNFRGHFCPLEFFHPFHLARTTLKLSYFFTCQVEFGFALSLYLVIYALDSGARWSVLDKNNVANNNNRTQDRDSQSVIQSGDILAPEKLLLGLDLPINFHHE